MTLAGGHLAGPDLGRPRTRSPAPPRRSQACCSLVSALFLTRASHTALAHHTFQLPAINRSLPRPHPVFSSLQPSTVASAGPPHGALPVQHAGRPALLPLPPPARHLRLLRRLGLVRLADGHHRSRPRPDPAQIIGPPAAESGLLLSWSCSDLHPYSPHRPEALAHQTSRCRQPLDHFNRPHLVLFPLHPLSGHRGHNGMVSSRTLALEVPARHLTPLHSPRSRSRS